MKATTRRLLVIYASLIALVGCLFGGCAVYSAWSTRRCVEAVNAEESLFLHESAEESRFAAASEGLDIARSELGYAQEHLSHAQEILKDDQEILARVTWASDVARARLEDDQETVRAAQAELDRLPGKVASAQASLEAASRSYEDAKASHAAAKALTEQRCH